MTRAIPGCGIEGVLRVGVIMPDDASCVVAAAGTTWPGGWINIRCEAKCSPPTGAERLPGAAGVMHGGVAAQVPTRIVLRGVRTFARTG